MTCSFELFVYLYLNSLTLSVRLSGTVGFFFLLFLLVFILYLYLYCIMFCLSGEINNNYEIVCGLSISMISEVLQ